MPEDLTPVFSLLPAEQEVALPSPFFDAGTQTVGGFMAGPTSMGAGSVTYNAAGEQILIGQATSPTSGIGVFIGNTGNGFYDFRAGDPSGSYIRWDAQNSKLTVRGTIQASSIDIPDTTTANSFHVNSNGDAWWGATTFGAAPATVSKSGAATFTNIVATGTINAQGGYLGAPTTVLNISTSGLDVGTTGHLAGGQSAYNTGVGFFLGYSGAAFKLSIGDPNGDYLTWDGSTLSTNKFSLTGIGSFGGNGSDGTLSISSGTTTIDLGNAAYVVKNYKSISITGTGKLAFINPHANGTVIILKSQGAVVLTSSTVPCIDASGLGAAGGAARSGSGSGLASGNDGNPGQMYSLFLTAPTSGKGGAGTGGAAGAIPSLAFQTSFYSSTQYFQKYQNLWTAAGGGSGQYNGSTSPATGTTGAGGNGGGTLIIECGGALNFTGTVSVAGQNGANGAASVATCNCAGGGGGGGGFFLCLYNSLTANSGTVTVSGGTGGNNNAAGGAASAAGGGSGANGVSAGSAGTANNTNSQGGANGPAGISVITQNTFFA